jgi:hypothetical protein
VILHIFTEEASIKNVFDVLLPKILPPDVSFRIYPHQGKQDLERAISKTVPSISKMPGSKILITRDQDYNDCKKLKKKLLNWLEGKCSCDLFVRIVCRELESWFLGDLQAVEKAFNRFNEKQYSGKKELRNVDSVNKPSDYLRRIIPEYSNKENLPKLEASSKIAKYMNINNNKSSSFNHTINAIKKLCEYQG